MTKKWILAVVCMLSLSTIGGAEMNDATMLKIYNADKKEYEVLPTIVKTEAEWKAFLTDEQFKVARKHDTERPFKNAYNDNHRHGIYKCIACGTDLFLSLDKYESGTGWPSFTKPIASENVATQTDNSFFGKRIEVHCARCKSHLGHVFDDGPKPTGKRFCMNSATMKFVEKVEK